MNRTILGRGNVAPLRDDRYGRLWELAGAQTGLGAISAAYVVVDPGAISPRHWHRTTEELYMVVAGEGVMDLDGVAYEIGPGDAVSIPRGVVHAIGAWGPEPLAMWVCTTPAYTEDDDFEVEA